MGAITGAVPRLVYQGGGHRGEDGEKFCMLRQGGRLHGGAVFSRTGDLLRRDGFGGVCMCVVCCLIGFLLTGGGLAGVCMCVVCSLVRKLLTRFW